MKKRLLSSLLALCMLLGLLPVSAFAVEGEAPVEVQGPMIYRGLEYLPSIDFGSSNLGLLESWSDNATFTGNVYEGYYAQLDETSQNLYKKLQEAFATPKTEVQLNFNPALGPIDNDWLAQHLYPAYEALVRDHPEMPWLESRGYSVPYAPDGSYIKYVLTGVPTIDTSVFTSAVNSAKSEIDKKINGSTDRYVQVKAINDYLCDLITYEADGDDNIPFDQTSYSALVAPNKTVCAGYTTSFKLLCDKYNIPCVYVSGDAGGPHAWNLIKMNNSDTEWYAVDTTWADQKTYISYEYFLSGSDTLTRERNSAGTLTGNNKKFSENHVAQNTWLYQSPVALPYPAMNTEAYRTSPYAAEPTGSLSQNQYVVATYGQTLAEVTMPGDPRTMKEVGKDETIAGTFAWKNTADTVGNVTEGNTVSPRLRAIFTPGDTDKYNAVEVLVYAKVNPATLTITGATVEPKTTGDDTTAKITSVAFNGLVGDETLTLGTDYTVTGTYTDTGSAGQKNVTVTVTLNSTDTAKNYTLSNSSYTATGTVNDKGAHQLTVPGNQTLTYGGTKTVTAASSTGGTITYASSDDNVVSVDTSGKLTAHKVGSATITVTAAASSGYTEATGTFTVTVEKATPTASATVKGDIYPTSTTVAFEGTAAYKGQSVAGSFALDGAFPTLPAVGQTVTFNWVFTPTDAANYNPVKGTASAEVKASTVTSIAIASNPTKTEYVYGEAIDPAGLTITVTKTDGTETVNGSDAGVTITKPDAVGETVAVTVSYGGKSATFNVKVTAKALTVKSATATSRVYDGTTGVAITAVELDGKVGADEVSVNLSGVTGTLSGANAGTYSSVSLNGLSLTGAKASCYTLAATASGVSANVTISKATPSVTVAPKSGATFLTSDTASAVVDKLDVTIKGLDDSELTGGTFTLTDTNFTSGTKEYGWKYTPSDTNYEEKSGTVSLTFTEDKVTALSLTENVGAKKSYVYGEEFDLSGWTIQATYASGKTETVDASAVTYDKDLGDVGTGKTVTVALTKDGVTVSASPITGIEVTAKPLDISGINWDISGSPFTYDGTAKEVELAGTIPEEMEATATSGNTGTDAGDYTATTTLALKSGLKESNYTITGDKTITAAWKINKAALTGTNANVTVKFSDTTEHTVTAGDFGIDQVGTFATNGAISDAGGILSGAPTYGASIKFALASELSSAVSGQTATIPVTFTSSNSNYEPVDLTLTVTVTDKDIPELSVSAFTKVYNGTAVTVDELTKSATVGGEAVEGTWAFKATAPTDVADSGAYVLVFTPDDLSAYEVVETPVTITITKATPTGTPAYTAITASGKTLADANLTIGTITPAGSIAWKLASTTAVQANTAYEWVFTPTDSDNYNELTGRITLYNYTQPDRPSGGGSSSGGSSSGGSSSGGSTSSSGPVSTGSGTQNGDRVTQTTAKPSASVSGGTASSEISSSTGKEIVNQAVKNDSDTVVIAPNIRGNVSATEVTVPSETIGDLGRKTDADVVVDTPVAQVTIPNGALSSLSRGDLTVSARRQGSTLSVTVQSGSQTIYSVSGGLTVTAPVSRATSGTVAMLVNSDGSRQVIRKSVVVDGIVNIPLEGSARVEIVDNSKRFNDVPASNWAYGAVSFASGHELFNGTGAGIFSPDASMTRGMLAVVLHNLEGNPNSYRNNNFLDISSSAWYAEAVTWAAEQGIVSGYTNGAFGANDSVTREQLALMLYHYAGSPRVTSDRTARFIDASSISGYAKTAMDWAVENGIISGVGDSQLNPKGQATRAQVAQMLKNYVEGQF